ncbi:uncharacterized protein PAC_10619 [Phialocephala subalpina]|uniref:AAA+ ATPase domain-containing protein n=1 Tax=Phialocephala subalpina TaxID=576137 RepID=A0A1L7X6T5_9HELO|nr:uncharacterized protein PAC_10619 [Phialocephala subalpina]
MDSSVQSGPNGQEIRTKNSNEKRYQDFEPKPSRAEKEWVRMKNLGDKNTKVNEVMDLIGLEDVKQQFLSILAKEKIHDKQKIKVKNDRFHAVLLGNPGTGKTTIAKLYGEFLEEIKVLNIDRPTVSGNYSNNYEPIPDPDFKAFRLFSGAKLAIQGAQQAQDEIKEIAETGGIIFIDETYQLLSPHNSSVGAAILDIVLTTMEENIGKLAVLFAGYNRDMQTFFEHNQGLRSRIPYTFHFQDFNNAQLLTILAAKIEEKYGLDNSGEPKMKVEEEIDGRLMKVKAGKDSRLMRVVIRRLAAGRDLRGFGNARAVENLLAQISERQARRLAEEERSKKEKAKEDLEEWNKRHDEKVDREKLKEQLKTEKEEIKQGRIRLHEELRQLRDRKTELTKQVIDYKKGNQGSADDEEASKDENLTTDAAAGVKNDSNIDEDGEDWQLRGIELDETENDTETESEKPNDNVTLDDDAIFCFTRDDLIGPPPSTAEKSLAYSELQKLTGLKSVKLAVDTMIGMLETNYERELEELYPLTLSLNQVFFGAPGTGKTTVAKLYGQILSELALLSDGEVVVKNPSDFIGNAVGVSESNTRNILAATVGKVLVIDEAYMLHSGIHSQGSSYGTSVIDTIVAEVQGIPGDDRCIILVGYEDRLKEMFQNANPGLARRFRIDRAFRFENFNTEELMKILKKKMDDEDIKASPQALKVAQDVLERAQMRANFSNAGDVVTLLDTAKMNFQARIQNIVPRPVAGEFQREDFDLEWNRRADAAENCSKALEGKVSQSLVVKLQEWIHSANDARELEEHLSDSVPSRIMIKGPPGTGKKTTARQIAKVFYDIGYLATDELVTKSVSDLLGQYVGHTAPKTKALLESCLGKTLFIHDAERLAEHSSYAAETVAEFASLLDTPKYFNKMVLVFAGTPQDMENLMSTRPALSQLFRDNMVSEPLTPDECMALLFKLLEDKSISAPFLKEPASKDYMETKVLMARLTKSPLWKNATHVGDLAKQMATPVLATWRANKRKQHEAKTNGTKDENGHSRKTNATKVLMARLTKSPLWKNATHVGDLAKQMATPVLATWRANKRKQHEAKTNGTKDENGRKQTPHSQSNSAFSPLDPLSYPKPEREKGVSEEEFQRVQEEYRSSIEDAKKKSKADQAYEQKKKKLLMEMERCPAGYEWYRKDNMWHCRGGYHDMSDEDIVAKLIRS